MSTPPEDDIDLAAELELSLAEEIAVANSWDAEEEQDYQNRYVRKSAAESDEHRFYGRYENIEPLTKREVKIEYRAHSRDVNIARSIAMGAHAGIIHLELSPRMLSLWEKALVANRLQVSADVLVELMVEPGRGLQSVEDLTWEEFSQLCGLVQKRFTEIRLMERHGLIWRSVGAQRIRRYAHGGC